MLSMTVQFVALLASLVQSAETMRLRIGEVARLLTEQDIAALEMVLPSGEKPWLLNGDRSQFANAQFVQAFLHATVSMPELRRGTAINVRRRNSRNPLERPGSGDPWVVQGTESYAQVAIVGRNFDQIQGEQDMNRPFRVLGHFDDIELVGLVKFLRSNPGTRGGESIQPWPILTIDRKADDSVQVLLREKFWQGQVILLRQAGQDWIIEAVGVWAA